MPLAINKSKLTIFSAVTGGFTLAYALAVLVTRSSSQTGSNEDVRTNAHHTNKKVVKV